MAPKTATHIAQFKGEKFYYRKKQIQSKSRFGVVDWQKFDEQDEQWNDVVYVPVAHMEEL